jgi:hypothetical protein
MKKVIGMLAVVALANSMASAELLKNFKADGNVEVNAYSVNNKDFNKDASDKTANTDTRVMLNMGFDLNEDVNAVVSAVKLNRQYGTGHENTDNLTANVFFEQAYLNLKNVFGIDHKLGRQYYGNAGDMVIYYGPATMPYTAKFTPSISAIDGWTGWYKFNVLNRDWNVNAIIAKENNGGTTYPSKDINVTGVNVKTNVDRWNLNAYYYQKVDQKTAAKTNYLDVAGARANWECMFVKNLNIGAEYDMNMGTNRNTATDYKGYAYKANVDYSMDLAGKLAFNGEYAVWSGDKNLADKDNKKFQAINGDYRPGIIMGGGFVGAAGTAGTGSTTYNVGANWTPEKLNKLNFGAKYYNFSTTEKNTAADKHLGNEVDVMATWTHSASVSVSGYYAMFSPEKKNVGANHDTENMMGALFNVKF